MPILFIGQTQTMQIAMKFSKISMFILLLLLISCSGLQEQLVNLKSSRAQNRVEAIYWLHDNVKNKTTEKLLEEALSKDDSPIVRSSVIRLMVLSKDKKYLPLIEKALDDKDSLVRMEAAQSIGSFHAFESRELLGKKLENETDDWVKLKIIKSLRYLKAKNVIMPLINSLDNQNPSIRFQALATLEKFTNKKLGSKSEMWKKWYEGVQETEKAPVIPVNNDLRTESDEKINE